MKLCEQSQVRFLKLYIIMCAHLDYLLPKQKYLWCLDILNNIQKSTIISADSPLISYNKVNQMVCFET